MGTWQNLANQPSENSPSFNASTMLLLTDGTVMVLDDPNPSDNIGGKSWWRLTPDQNGSYVNGKWSALSSMINTRRYFGSAVLMDGRVFVAGGENSDAGGDTNLAEIYDPLTNTWKSTAAFNLDGWSSQLGDVPLCMLPDGRILVGSIASSNTAIYDPTADTWTAAATKEAFNANEETWTLLPDQTVLTVECQNSPNAEKYLPDADKWVTAGPTPVTLVMQDNSIEIGPALLMPDGRAFCIGATGRTAFYTPPNLASKPGTWTAGPSFPNDSTGQRMEAKDAAGCLMPNGRVLLVAGPASTGAGSFPGPTQLLEFDGNTINTIDNPSHSSNLPFQARLLLLPTGEVLFADGSNKMAIYAPDGDPDPNWKPQITSCPARVRIAQTYALQGRQLNGLSQAVSYGDDATMATNYPIVRMTNRISGKVYYCRTHDHSTMGVATGSTIQSTNFTVPCGVEAGEYDLVVIANGIASDALPVTAGNFVNHLVINEAAISFLIGNLADGPLWVLTPNGPVPVDPWGPEIARPAREAFHEIVRAVKTLRDLGRKVEKLTIEQRQLLVQVPTPAPAVS